MMFVRNAVSKGRLSALLVFALVLVNFQCAALCAAEPCNSIGTAQSPSPADVPPCHQHHEAPSQQAPAPCSHQLVVQAHTAQAPLTLVFTASFMAMDRPVELPGAFPWLSSRERSAAHAPSPPSLAILSSVVLRV
jgi:hypothetical protein